MSTGDIGTSTNGAKKGRNRILPRDRIAVPKQLGLLRAWAIASGPTNKTVSNEDVAVIVKMVPSTVSMANAFFVDNGFLIRQQDGGFIPALDVMNFNHSYEWNPETAAHKLTPIIERTWFAQSLLPRIGYSPLGTDEAIQVLAETAGFPIDKKPQLAMLLEFMKVAGIVNETSGVYRLGRTPTISTTTNTTTTAAPNPPTIIDPQLVGDTRNAARGTTFTTFSAAPTEGVIQFHVSVRVDMKEFAGWEADRIGAFFSGIAEVLKAKGAIEKNANQGI